MADHFHCEAMSCTMHKKWCIRYQKEAGEQDKRFGAEKYRPCPCRQGADIKRGNPHINAPKKVMFAESKRWETTGRKRSAEIEVGL